jgi:hypothetical protein
MLNRTVLALALGAILLAIVAAATGATTPSKTIATTSSSDFRADLVAQRSSGGKAPTANLTVVTYERGQSAWKRLGSRRVAGTFFWKTVTGPRAICKLELATVGHPRVIVQTLVTPAIGCGKAATVPLSS